MIVVHKFGGSCFRDANSLRLVLTQLHEVDALQFVAISAMYGITDLIREFLDHPFEEEEIDELISTIQLKHASLNKDVSLNDELDRFRSMLNGIYLSNHVSENARNLILTFGERLMVLTLHHLIPNSTILYPEDFLQVSDLQGEGEYLLNSSSDKLRDRIDFDTKGIYLVPGFYGIAKNGVINTVGSSGTDYTGAVLANITNAERYIIWKDVSGFMTIDPLIHDKAKVIEVMNYDEAEELSFFGATLIHEKTISVLRPKQIPLVIRNINSPKIETIIQPHSDEIPKSVSFISDVAILRIKEHSTQQSSRIAKITELLRKLNIKIYSLAATYTTISLILPSIDFNQYPEFQELHAEIIEHQSIIALVGENAIRTTDVQRIISHLKSNSIVISFMLYGINERASFFACDENEFKEAAILLHDLYF